MRGYKCIGVVILGLNHITMKAKDWEIYLSFPCTTIEKAIEIEGPFLFIPQCLYWIPSCGAIA
jgi:hypothetical protein